MHDPDRFTTAYRFFTEVGIINQLISTKLESLLPGRMSSTQFGILGHLSRRPAGETPLQLARAFQVPKTSMTHMLAGLDTAGLIRIAPNPSDKRSKIAVATEAAHEFLREKNVALGRELAPVFAQLHPDAFGAAIPHLEQIRRVLDTERDPPA